MTVEEILIKLGVDSAAVGDGLRTAGSKIRQWGSEITRHLKDQFKEFGGAIAGYFAVDKLKEAFKGALEYARDVKLSAKETGLSTDLVQGLSEVWEKLNVNVQEANNGLAILNRKVGEARAGSDEALKLFQKWGISIDGKSQEEIFYEIADAAKSMTDPALRSAMAFDLMGKGSKELATALPVGAKAIKEIAEEADKSSEKQLNRLTALDARLESMARKWHIIWGSLISSMVDTPAPVGVTEKEVEERMRKLNPHFNPAFPRANMSGAALDALRDRAIAEIAGERKDVVGEQRGTEGQKKAHEEAEKLRKEAQDNLDKAAAKAKTDQEQLDALLKKRVELEYAIVDAGDDDLANGKANLEFSKNELAIAEKQKEIKKAATEEAKKQKELAEKIATEEERLSYLTKKRSEDLMAPATSTLEEIANSSRWVKGGWSGRWMQERSPFAGDAREIERLQTDAKNALLYYGNKDRAREDLRQANVLRGRLEEAGVISPERRLESIDMEMQKLTKTIDGDKLKIKPVNGE